MSVPRNCLAVAAAVLVIACPSRPVARAQSSPDAVVKAGFVYNFAKFAEWPAGALSDSQVTLCLVGGDPMAAVSNLLEGKPLHGRTLTVRRNVRGDEIKGCGIVYLTDIDERRQNDALRVLRNLPVLTIGDAEGFAEAGGMIGLVASDDRIQFEVNIDVSQRAGLKIHSQLLKLARSVKGRVP